MDHDSQHTIGNIVTVSFINVGNKQISGKVDTGATTSSLHASDINISKDGRSVAFRCDQLSNGTLTMPMDGDQTVHTSDNGGERRPIVRMNIDIDGVALRDVAFNLNDRSGMDSPVLIGQNILGPGNFIVDVNKDNDGSSESNSSRMTRENHYSDDVIAAMKVLAESNITISDLITYLQTEAITTLKQQ